MKSFVAEFDTGNIIGGFVFRQRELMGFSKNRCFLQKKCHRLFEIEKNIIFAYSEKSVIEIINVGKCRMGFNGAMPLVLAISGNIIGSTPYVI